MNLIQFCWLLFVLQTWYFFYYTKWSVIGHRKLKFIVCAMVSLVNTLIIYGIVSVFKWLRS